MTFTAPLSDSQPRRGNHRLHRSLQPLQPHPRYVLSWSIPSFDPGLTVVPRHILGGRSTAVRLESGKVVLFASTPGDEASQQALNNLAGAGGTVSHIIALDAVHHLYISDFAKLYPNAKIVGPKGLVSKRKDVKFDIVLPDSPLDPELEKEFRAIPLTGHPNEVRGSFFIDFSPFFKKIKL